MAGFKVHVATSTTVGACYGAAGLVQADIPLPNCLLATGLCSIAGILPDVDSETGVPLRETMTFLAAVTPMLMIDRFRQLGLTHESIALAGVCLYIIVRFGLAEILRRVTVHRGMWHSIPAAVTAGLLASLVCTGPDQQIQWFQSGAVVVGYITHLLLDELYSLEWYRGRLRFKRTAGTAFKLFGPTAWANTLAYGLLFAVTTLAMHDPVLTEPRGRLESDAHQMAREFVDRLWQRGT